MGRWLEKNEGGQQVGRAKNPRKRVKKPADSPEKKTKNKTSMGVAQRAKVGLGGIYI